MTVVCYCSCAASVSRQLGFSSLCECNPGRWWLYVIVHASVGRQLGFGLLSECFVTFCHSRTFADPCVSGFPAPDPPSVDWSLPHTFLPAVTHCTFYCCFYYWSLLYNNYKCGASLCSWADPPCSCCMWFWMSDSIRFYRAFFNIIISNEVVYWLCDNAVWLLNSG